MFKDLDNLIADIGLLADQQSMNIILEDEINELIASALEEMGVRQIMDTGQARSIFIDIAREHLGVDFSYIFTEVTDIWGNLDRGRDAYNFDPYDYFENDSFGKEIGVAIYDWGVIGQEEGIDGKKYPSDMRPDKELYKPEHLSEVSDLAQTGNLPKFEAKVRLIEEKLIRIIKGRW